MYASQSEHDRLGFILTPAPCESASNNMQRYLHPSAADVGIPVRFQKRQAAFSGSVVIGTVDGDSVSDPISKAPWEFTYSIQGGRGLTSILNQLLTASYRICSS